MREPPRGLRGSVLDSTSDDEALVRSALHGSADAYERLYRRHRDSVARTAYVLTSDAHLAQDAAQEAFLVGWRDLGRLRDPARFRSWITGITVHLCRRRGGGFRILPGPRPAARGKDAPATPGTDAEARIAVRAAIAGLPRPMREVIVLRFYVGFTEPEVARALGVAVGTVKSRVARARARLAAALGEEIEEG